MLSRMLFSVAGLALVGWTSTVAAQGAERPNIVFILADDLGVNDLACYGRADHVTPRLDRLAGEGMRFTSAYCAQPICSASRAAIMTGKPPAQLHLTNYLPGRPNTPAQLLLQPKIHQQLPLEETTIAEMLREAGYATACIGKWHLGGKGFSPLEQGFDVYYEGEANTEPTADEGGKGEFDLTRHAIEFIDAHRERPFFLYLAHNNPHIRLAETEDRVGKHAGAFNPTYAATVETLDRSVGRLLDHLESLGLTEKTLVVFTSDNGGLHVPEGELTPATHNAPYRAGKGFLYEGGLRIPLIVRWPGKVPTGKLADDPVSNLGWHHLLATVTGGKPSGEEDAALSHAVLTGEGKVEPTPLFWHFPHYTNQGSRPGGAIRDGDWKLIEHYEDGRLELFNLREDVAETKDVSAAHPARVAELRGKLEAWRRSIGAQENVANPEFDTARWRPLYGDVDASSIQVGETFQSIREAWQPWRRLMNAAAKAEPGDGAVILNARDATAHGEKLLYETPPHKDTLGYWVNPNDWAEWSFTAPTAGEYDVEILQGCGDGSGGAEVELRVGDSALTFIVEETGHFQRFVPRQVGTLKLSKGPQTLTVRAKSKPNAAVMDLRRVTFRPH
jgi:arylsulfatase A